MLEYAADNHSIVAVCFFPIPIVLDYFVVPGQGSEFFAYHYSAMQYRNPNQKHVAMRKPISICGTLFLSVLMCLACGNDPERTLRTDSHPDEPEAVNGLCGIGVPDPADPGNVAEDPVIFTDEQIAWFNPVTREIRFRDIEPAQTFPRYRSILFRLDDQTLFTAATIVGDLNSQVYYDLVLYYSDPVEPRYYLHDAYPAWAADTEQARANADVRAEGWNSFLEHLRQDGRLQE